MVANANQRLTNHGPILPNDLQTTLESQGFQSEQIKEMLFPMLVNGWDYKRT